MPFDNLKTRLQGGNAGHYNGMIDCAVQTMREEGVRAFWRGTSPRLVRLTVSPIPRWWSQVASCF